MRQFPIAEIIHICTDSSKFNFRSGCCIHAYYDVSLYHVMCLRGRQQTKPLHDEHYRNDWVLGMSSPLNTSTVMQTLLHIRSSWIRRGGKFFDSMYVLINNPPAEY